uniref:Nucleotide-diphospho-sugar transferase domain-containing protein n=1 Tax=Emiliania huxleyi TaxID=2903 RepID=A0A7S3T5T8_EMIHU
MGARFTALLLVGAASLMILASSMFGSSSSGAGRIVHVTERGVAAARQQQLAATAAGSRSRLTNLAEAAPGGGGAAAPPLATATASAASPERPAARGALDGSLEAALRVAVPGEAPGFVMASFANSALNDHLVNFVLCAVRARAPFVIGAVDQAAFTMLSARRDAPTYVTPMAKEGASLDGSNQHSSGSWKRFAGMRTGEVLRMVRLGYSVLHTDIDVVWLRSPEPYLMCSGEASRPGGEHGPGSRFECGPLLSADVAVSSDNMSPGRDTEGRASYSAGGTFNTGILFLRPTVKGRAFAEEWHANVVSPPPGSRYVSLTSDQQDRREAAERLPRGCRDAYEKQAGHGRDAARGTASPSPSRRSSTT